MAKGPPRGNGTPNDARRRAFILAIARGQSVTKAAAAAGVTSRTGFRWMRLPAVRDAVAAIRAAMLDRAAGRLVGTIERAAATMGKLLTSADKPSEVLARLAVARAILADYLSIRAHTELAEQNAEILRRLDEHEAIIRRRRLDRPAAAFPPR
jgi:hypothetical protein